MSHLGTNLPLKASQMSLTRRKEAGSVKAIDRVMAAYLKGHKLSDEQTDAVRKELSIFIDQFLEGPMAAQNEPQGGRNGPSRAS
jgi:hypothetical protein